MIIKNLIIILLLSNNCFAQKIKEREFIRRNTDVYVGITSKIPYDTNFYKVYKIVQNNNFLAKAKNGIIEISPKTLGRIIMYIYTNKGIQKVQLQSKRLSEPHNI